MCDAYISPIQPKLQAVIFDCDDPKALAVFYAKLLGGSVTADPYGGYTVSSAAFEIELGFQADEDYQRPVWLGEIADQQPMVHLDLRVENREAAVTYALSIGAELPKQFCQPEWAVQWTTLLDPAGHPFCFFDADYS